MPWWSRSKARPYTEDLKALFGRRWVGVWIGGVWNGHLRFSPNFRLRILKTRSQKIQFHTLVIFKAQLGEPFLEFWLFLSIFLFFSSVFIFLLFGKPALKRAKTALKQPNQHLKTEKNEKDSNRHLLAQTSTWQRLEASCALNNTNPCPH